MNTTQAYVDPAALLSALRRMNDEGTPYQFVETSAPVGYSKLSLTEVKPAFLSLWVDGAKTPHTVTLNPDGTFEVTAAVEL